MLRWQLLFVRMLGRSHHELLLILHRLEHCHYHSALWVWCRVVRGCIPVGGSTGGAWTVSPFIVGLILLHGVIDLFHCSACFVGLLICFTDECTSWGYWYVSLFSLLHGVIDLVHSLAYFMSLFIGLTVYSLLHGVNDLFHCLACFVGLPVCFTVQPASWLYIDLVCCIAYFMGLLIWILWSPINVHLQRQTSLKPMNIAFYIVTGY